MKMNLRLSQVCLGLVALLFTVRVLADDNSRVYVVFKHGQKATAKALVHQAAGQIHHEFDELRAIATTLPTAALNGLSRNPNIELIEEDPPRFMLGQVVPYGIDMVQARDVWDSDNNGIIDSGAPTGAGLTIGVIDSGVYTGHEDFVGVTFSGEPSGWDSDLCHHGTHVCGTIVAANNSLGVIGVSPGTVKIHMVKVFGDDCGWTYSSSLINAAQKCQNAGAKIISMSLGGGTPTSTEDQGFQNLYNAGILLVAAAGNGGNTAVSYPAGYASVISVAAVDQNQVVASFSQRNSDVELAAPGVSVLSTVPYTTDKLTVDGADYLANHIENAAYGIVSGALVNGGRATSVPSDGSWSGKVVLVERGDISFYQKVQNVQAGGGVAAAIYNNAPGNFSGTLGTGNSSTIPAISLSQEDGQYLVANKLAHAGTVNSNPPQVGSGYAFFDGTSMATPHVAAVAALVWSDDLNRSNAQIRDALQNTANDLGAAGRDTSYGFGLVQAKAALDFIRSGGSGGDTTPPAISNVTTQKTGKGGTFRITWSTDEPSTSVVTFTGGGTGSYTDSTLVTSHSMSFRGKNNVRYTFNVTSTDAAGNSATAGPFTHQN